VQDAQARGVVGGVEGVESVDSGDGPVVLGELDEGEALERLVRVARERHVVDRSMLLEHATHHIVVISFGQVLLHTRITGTTKR
jgi:hypothetical protein